MHQQKAAGTTAATKQNCLLVTALLFVLSYQTAWAQTSQVTDKPFMQEYHEAYTVGKTAAENEVRSIAVDASSTVWIATAAGIFFKKNTDSAFTNPFTEADNGPAYSVVADKAANLWMGTWNGAWVFTNNSLQKLAGVPGPVSVVCTAAEGVYLLGPNGIWLYNGKEAVKKNYAVARSVRAATTDNNGGIWIGTDVGLYHSNAGGTTWLQNTDVLVSASIKGVALDAGNKIWAGGLGGVSVISNGKKIKEITAQQGNPSVFVNCVRQSPEGVMWVGGKAGVLRFYKNGSHSLLFSRRWLISDEVNDIAFDPQGNAWVATAKGVSAIKRRSMTLADKQDYFYDVLMKRHIRKPWTAGQVHLNIDGDVNSWQAEDDDNDGEFNGNYLAMESFRYAATKSDDARQKAKKAFNFLKQQQEVTGGDGYFARSIVPLDWSYGVHDTNQVYTEREKAEELVKEPRFKPVEHRWRKSADGQWMWKGDASSDEWCGHMLGYFFYYQLVAGETEKVAVRQHVSSLIDHLIAHDFNMNDVDGTHTRWSVWSPNLLNHDPEWAPDKGQNSMELLAFIKFAYYITGNQKYQQHYLRLIEKEHYLDNMAGVIHQNPAWFIYYDVIMQSYLYPIFLTCEKDPKLLAFYRHHLEQFMQQRRGDKCPLINFFYCYATHKKAELDASYQFLVDTPLDLIDWTIDHSKREDVTLTRTPVMDDLQVKQLPPASIRSTVRWDKNPWAAIGGYPYMEREPVFWLFPYWMGRYLKMIQ